MLNEFKNNVKWCKDTMIQTSTLLDDLGDGAGFVSRHDEDVLQAVQDDLHHLRVLHRQQAAEGRDDVLLHQELHLQKANTYTLHYNTGALE